MAVAARGWAWPLARELRATKKGFEILSSGKKVELRYEWVDKPPSKPVERFWVGRTIRSWMAIGIGVKREVFKAAEIPSSLTHPQYYAVIGPFKTKGGAEFMQDYGEGNPHCQTVADAERLAKQKKLA